MNFQYKKYIFPLIFIVFYLFFGISTRAEASNVYGFAWSENIGWISFNSCSSPSVCGSGGVSTPSHGVSLDPGNNKVSGTAWNKNIGTISFNPNDWGTCPPDAGGCNLGTFVNKWEDGGWARAVSVIDGTGLKSNSGGWDGWVSLGRSGVYGANINFSSPVNMADGDFSTNTYTVDNTNSSYWWGGDVIGWIDLNPFGGEPYDTTNGGVFISELDNNLSLVGPSYITAGNKATLIWEAKNGFFPTECQRTSDPATDWDQGFYSVNTTSETLIDIEVPHDNNTAGTKTKYMIECTDGAFSYQAEWDIIVNKFAPEVYFPYACMVKDSIPPLEIIKLGDANDYSCNIYANDGINSPRIVDSIDYPDVSFNDNNWNNLSTNYTLECINGNSNQAYYQSTQSTYMQICEPFFEVYGDTRCGTTQFNEKYGDELIFSGANYVANVILTLNSFYGFDEDPVQISSPDSNISFSSNTFNLSGGNYNTITATYTINEANYITATNDEEDPIVVPINLSPNSKTTLNLNFCPAGSGFIKYLPKYNPF